MVSVIGSAPPSLGAGPKHRELVTAGCRCRLMPLHHRQIFLYRRSWIAMTKWLEYQRASHAIKHQRDHRLCCASMLVLCCRLEQRRRNRGKEAAAHAMAVRSMQQVPAEGVGLHDVWCRGRSIGSLQICSDATGSKASIPWLTNTTNCACSSCTLVVGCNM